jgi:hypothetical protein
MSEYLTLKSEIDWLRGYVQSLAKNQRRLGARIEKLQQTQAQATPPVKEYVVKQTVTAGHSWSPYSLNEAYRRSFSERQDQPITYTKISDPFLKDMQIVAQFLKGNGIALAYDDKFLESKDHRVLGFPNAEVVRAWKRLMELA